VYDALQPMADDYNRKRRAAYGSQGDKAPTPPTGADGLNPESEGMMKFLYQALQPMTDDYNRRRREAYK